MSNTTPELPPHIKRENLYRALSKRGNPELRTLFNILHGMGLRLAVLPEKPAPAN
jgi:DNA-binding phage protein